MVGPARLITKEATVHVTFKFVEACNLVISGQLLRNETTTSVNRLYSTGADLELLSLYSGVA